jgi:Zn-dependent protease with chaperone function
MRSKKIFLGEENRFWIIIITSVLSGLSLSLLFFGCVFFINSITGREFQLNLDIFTKSCLFFLIPGFFVFLGSLWKYFLAGIYRKQLLKIIKRKVEKKSLTGKERIN